MTDLIKFMGGDDVSYSASAGKKTAKLKKKENMSKSKRHSVLGWF